MDGSAAFSAVSVAFSVGFTAGAVVGAIALFAILAWRAFKREDEEDTSDPG